MPLKKLSIYDHKWYMCRSIWILDDFYIYLFFFFHKSQSVSIFSSELLQQRFKNSPLWLRENIHVSCNNLKAEFL